MMKNFKRVGRYKGNKHISSEILGLKVKDAQEMYKNIRVVKQGEKLKLTEEVDPKRINVEVDGDNTITKIISWG